MTKLIPPRIISTLLPMGQKAMVCSILACALGAAYAQPQPPQLLTCAMKIKNSEQAPLIQSVAIDSANKIIIYNGDLSYSLKSHDHDWTTSNGIKVTSTRQIVIWNDAIIKWVDRAIPQDGQGQLIQTYTLDRVKGELSNTGGTFSWGGPCQKAPQKF